MGVPAVVAAGERRAAKAVHGESKPYLVLAGRTLVEHVVAMLQRVPEVSEVWVVGNAERLEAVLGTAAFRGELAKPLHVVPQFRNLYENAWETYRRLLPGAGPDGRDPGPDDADQPVLYLSADLPFATPQEVSAFVQQGTTAGCDYALGLSTEDAMSDFYPESPDGPGIHMAYFSIGTAVDGYSPLSIVIYAVPMVLCSYVGLFYGVIAKRWGNAGVIWASVLAGVVLGTAVVLVTLSDRWPSVGSWLQGQSGVVLAAGWTLLPLVALAGGGYALLRRAIP